MPERLTKTKPQSRPPDAPFASRPFSSALGLGGGQSLDKRTQQEKGAQFGHDFSQVRIHTDGQAARSAAALGANAFALGGDVVFGEGNYVPGSPETERLLAHELTHVVQQSQFGPGDWGRTSAKGDASEREADSLASQVMRGEAVQVRSAPGAALARDDDDDPPDPPDTPSPREKEKPGGPTDWGDKGFSFKWNWGSLWPKSADVDPGFGDAFTVPFPGPSKPDSPKPAPGTDFMPKPAPDPNPPYMPPPFQNPPTPFPGLGQSDPIAPQVPPLGAQPGLPGPLPPPSLFPPSPSPLPPMVPPLTLDPES